MESHLLQMRGLKRPDNKLRAAMFKSHLLQMRGLKRQPLHPTKGDKCRIFYRCVD